MITKTILPKGWPCSLEECPPGHFIPLEHPDELCFKSEYSDNSGRPKAFTESGEYYHYHESELVQPVAMHMEEIEA